MCGVRINCTRNGRKLVCIDLTRWNHKFKFLIKFVLAYCFDMFFMFFLRIKLTFLFLTLLNGFRFSSPKICILIRVINELFCVINFHDSALRQSLISHIVPKFNFPRVHFIIKLHRYFLAATRTISQMKFHSQKTISETIS